MRAACNRSRAFQWLRWCSRSRAAGANAVSYETDGLWAGHAVVIERPGLLIRAHVDHNGPETRIRKDFEALVTTFAW